MYNMFLLYPTLHLHRVIILLEHIPIVIVNAVLELIQLEHVILVTVLFVVIGFDSVTFVQGRFLLHGFDWGDIGFLNDLSDFLEVSEFFVLQVSLVSLSG